METAFKNKVAIITGGSSGMEEPMHHWLAKKRSKNCYCRLA
jgi:NADP-dependent 3-hydroxy acid dehydrogenase YdfG